MLMIVGLFLVMLAAVQSFSPNACKCTGDNSQAHDEIGELSYDFHLGEFCSEWDLAGQPQICGKPDSPDWCNDQWCYVSKACPSAERSYYFPDTELYYSYGACDAVDHFTERCAVTAAHAAMDALFPVPEDICKHHPELGKDGHLHHRALHGAGQGVPLRVGFDSYDYNEDGIIDDADFELMFHESDTDMNGCIDVCEFKHGQTMRNGCPLNKYDSLKLAHWEYPHFMNPEHPPWVDAEELSNYCTPKVSFVGAHDNEFWRCHNTRADWDESTKADHWHNPPYCTKNGQAVAIGGSGAPGHGAEH